MTRSAESRGRIGPLLLGLATLPIFSCGEARGPAAGASPPPVSGRVTVGGRPAEGVEVRLHPMNRFHDPDAPRPQAVTDKDGRFRLRTGGDRDGAPSGQYVATLVWPARPGGADRLGARSPSRTARDSLRGSRMRPRSCPPFEVGTAAVRKPGNR